MVQIMNINIDDDYYYFKLQYIVKDTNDIQTIEWKQKSWITEETIDDYEFIKSDPTEYSNLYGGAKFIGLGKTDSIYTFIDGNANSHEWWWNAVCSYTAYDNGIPAFNAKVAKSMKLYIDNPTCYNLNLCSSDFITNTQQSVQQ